MGKRILIGAVAVFAILAVLGAIEEANDQRDDSGGSEATLAVERETTPSSPRQTTASTAGGTDSPATTSPPADDVTPETPSELDPGIDTDELDAVISDLDDLLGDLSNSFNQTEGDMQP